MVATISLKNIYLDWMRWLITKVEPGILLDWRKYVEV